MFAMMIPFLQTIAFIVSGPDFTRLALLVAAARFQVQATLCSDTKQEVENKILEDNKKKKKIHYNNQHLYGIFEYFVVKGIAIETFFSCL